MIDIKQIRENPERFKKAAKDKNIEVDIDRLLAVDTELLAAKQRSAGYRNGEKPHRKI